MSTFLNTLNSLERSATLHVLTRCAQVKHCTAALSNSRSNNFNFDPNLPPNIHCTVDDTPQFASSIIMQWKKDCLTPRDSNVSITRALQVCFCNESKSYKMTFSVLSEMLSLQFALI